MRWVRLAILGAFVLAAASAGLAGSIASPRGDAADGPAVASDPPDLTATAEIRRMFMKPGQVAIAVTNHGDAPVRVLGVELLTDSFAPLGVQEFDTEVPPSKNARDLIVQYGEATCPDGVASQSEPASVALQVATEDATVHTVTLALSYPNGTLDRLVREACAAQALAASARIELGELTETAEGTLEGRLSVTPLGEAALGVTEVRGSVLFEVHLGDGSGAGAAGGVTVPLVFDAHRCDGHVVGDAKHPFGFTVWITIDGGDPVAAPIDVPEDRREALWAMLEVRCAERE
ncbi:hypothetical protein O1R50_16095 [Glycomyces luteolus]|uniref:DUF4232 domain-containing protein n=1 Tax=Glycomyces luteolus TaxID=2670330 RepID=A0A9X3SUB0_9ACTN|nr:hypothetical protein [Glycomyces luteolus]MDA1361153.1 hypothetical protein [Glycomyces luteolus]